MKKPCLLGAVCATTFIFSTSSLAAPMSFDFAGTGGDLNTNTLTVNGITAESFYWNVGGSNWAAADLYRRNTTNDHGLGVCSPNETACQGGTGPNDGGGDINELSNQLGYQEVIRLDKGSYASWVELWVSSLDSSETGTLYWGNSSDINTLLGGGSFSYTAGVFGSGIVEGDILALAAASGFDPSAQFVLFTPGNGLTTTCSSGCDNDYLVWKGAVNPVPVPAAVWLFASGLVGLVGIARRKAA